MPLSAPLIPHTSESLDLCSVVGKLDGKQDMSLLRSRACPASLQLFGSPPGAPITCGCRRW